VIPGLIFIAGAALLFGYSINKEMQIRVETEFKARRV